MSSSLTDPQPEDAQKSAGITTLFLRNRHLLWLTIIVILISGLASINSLPRIEDPRITNRGATVLTFFPGASAEKIEAQINEKIEQNLEEIDEIKNIESTARSGVSSISVELKDSVTTANNEEIFSKIRSRLQNVSGELPAGASLPFLDDKRGVTAYTMIVALSWEGEDGQEPLNLLQRVALDLQDRFQNTPNTELVRVFGGIEEEITITPDIGKLASLGISLPQLSRLIAAADSKGSAGELNGSNQRLRFSVRGELTTVERIAAIPLLRGSPSSGSLLQLGDVAKIERGYRLPEQEYALKAGKRVIYVAARADESVRVDRWTENALQNYAGFRADFDEEFIHSEILFEQNQYTQARLLDLTQNLFLGALVVVLIVLFTMGWKSALVVGAVLPLASAAAIFSFQFVGQSIHQMSIFGLIIALGLVIDSGIVMTDEVRKCLRAGMSRRASMHYAVSHLFVPLSASTFTTILGFMPIFLLPGNAGDFVGPIAVSVVLALIFSYLLALTVIPALASSASSPHSSERKRSWWRDGLDAPRLSRDFQSVTLAALRRPVLSMLLVTAVPFSGFFLIPKMDQEFFPASDRDSFEVQLFLPSDSSIEFTQGQVAKADAALADLSGIESIHWMIGRSTPSVYYNQIPSQDNNPAFAQAVIRGVSPERVEELVALVQQRLNQALPSGQPVVKKFAQGPPSVAPIEFRIIGPQLDTLRKLGEEVRAVMHKNEQIVHSRATVDGGEIELSFQADEDRAKLSELNLQEIQAQMQASFSGITGGSVLEDVQELPVRVRLSEDERSNIELASSLPFISPALGEKPWIPLAALGEVQPEPAIRQISRYNGQRVNTLFAYLTPEAKAVSVASELMAEIQAQVDPPAGYRIEVAGDSESQANAVGGLATFAPVLVTLMAAVLILTFRSVWLAGLVFSVAILSIGFGMISLFISGYPLGFNPFIGCIGLAGVVINDTIVILAAIRANPKARMGDIQEIVKETYGCGRHVLSTTFTTIGGFVPLLIFSGGSFWPPLAVIIAGGIGFSLSLALFYTPIAYQVYARIAFRKENKGAKQAQLSTPVG